MAIRGPINFNDYPNIDYIAYEKDGGAPKQLVMPSGVILESRYNSWPEYSVMMMALMHMQPEHLELIKKIFVDSKAGAIYSLSMKREEPYIADCFAKALIRVQGGYNGVYIEGSEYDLGPWW